MHRTSPSQTTSDTADELRLPLRVTRARGVVGCVLVIVVMARARRAAVNAGLALVTFDARWIVGLSLGLSGVSVLLSLLAGIPFWLLPTVLPFVYALLVAGLGVCAPVHGRWPERRRALLIVVVVGILATSALGIGAALASRQQKQQATGRCLATADRIASPRRASPRADSSGKLLRLDLAALGAAPCDQMAAGDS